MTKECRPEPEKSDAGEFGWGAKGGQHLPLPGGGGELKGRMLS